MGVSDRSAVVVRIKFSTTWSEVVESDDVAGAGDGSVGGGGCGGTIGRTGVNGLMKLCE